jgi:hypothetical protein
MKGIQMRYFMYSPLDFSVEQAFAKAQDHLMDNHIVHVTPYSHRIVPPQSGQRPQAAPNTYLVRVEQDNSFYVVQKRIEA